MAALQKFMFDREFPRSGPAPAPIVVAAAEAAAEAVAAEQAPAEPPPPTFTEEELESARAEAFAQGRTEGLREASEAIERETRDILDAVETALRELMWSQSAIETQAAEDAVRVALAAIRRLFPALAEHAPLVEIERMIREAMATVQGEATLNIYVNDRLRDPLAARIRTIAAAAGFQERVVLHGVAALASGDCRIEWTAGGVSRDVATILKAIETAAARAIPALLADAAPEAPAAQANETPAADPAAAPPPEPSATESSSAEKPLE